MRHIRQRALVCTALAGYGVFLAGCSQTTRQAQVRPPATTPAPSVSFALQALPFPEHTRFEGGLTGDPRPAIDVLVADVQASFNAGQKQYKAGNLEQARAEFDRAMDLILSSGFQADFDRRLSILFDQLGQSIKTYDLDAATNSQGSVEAPTLPAPIEEIADLTLPAGDPRLALKAERELIAVPHDLPLAVNGPVLQYLSFFTTPRGRAIVARGLERAGRYNDMIRRVLQEEGVPQDLIYLAQAESAFQPSVVSRAGARGIWQFMPYRGEEYDLQRSYWVDERSDPEKATRAAAHHLRDLYHMFGDWYLAMAAYNSGPMNVSKAIQRTGYADFWDLERLSALPKQTENYVPIIIALALVAKDPAIYGVQVTPEKPAQVDAVKLDHSLDLHLAADATGVNLDDLRLLNPELLRNVTPNDSSFELKLPAGTADRFEQNIQHVPEDKWTSWRLHEVQDGETLAEIARHYHVTLASLENANHFKPHTTVPAGFLLDVPAAPPRVRLVRYRVQRGDTLEGIADRFDVTVAELKRWNHMRGAHVSRGVRLRIYAGGEISDASHEPIAPPARNSAAAVRTVSKIHSVGDESLKHHVKRGETLYSIAREYGTTVPSLRQSNPFLSDRVLKAGDVLEVQR